MKISGGDFGSGHGSGCGVVGINETLVSLCAKRAYAGAAYLDEKMPGWELKVRSAGLNMASQNADIGGQLMGDYGVFYKTKGISYSVDEERDLGFAHSMRECKTREEMGAYYAELTRAWREVLLYAYGPDVSGANNPTHVKRMKGQK